MENRNATTTTILSLGKCVDIRSIVDSVIDIWLAHVFLACFLSSPPFINVVSLAVCCYSSYFLKCVYLVKPYINVKVHIIML